MLEVIVGRKARSSHRLKVVCSTMHGDDEFWRSDLPYLEYATLLLLATQTNERATHLLEHGHNEGRVGVKRESEVLRLVRVRTSWKTTTIETRHPSRFAMANVIYQAVQ